MATDERADVRLDPHAAERADLLDALRTHRALLRRTVDGLDDDAARRRTTVSELTLGGIVKHLAAMERQWCSFVTDGPADGPEIDWGEVDWSDPPAWVQEFRDGFRMLEGETLAGLLTAYDEAAAATDALVSTTDLDARQPLPSAPWFEPGATRSARRVFVHLVAETAQHAGHADIVREALDGQRTMG